MSSKTKIVVLRMKEIIYTAIFLGLAIFLISLFLIMFRPGKKTVPTSAQTDIYVPGVYTASLLLGSQNINVEVTVDADRISSVSMVSLDDSVTTMYPLMQPALEDLAKQICDTQSTKNLSYPMETRYTSNALIQAIDTALAKAQKN
ncbi:MAG: hypothetical protein ACLT46_15290 [Hungatella sp.]